MRVLVIGCGSIGTRRARLLKGMGHEVYVVDEDMDRALELVDIGCVALAYGNWRVMADYLDAAFVCTPAETHISIARECAELGLGVFVEKPLSHSLTGLPELIQTCEERGVVTMGACNMRWAYPQVIEPGPLTALCTGPLEEWGEGSERYRKHGIILEAAIHELDLCRWLNGEITDIEVACASEDMVSLKVKHANGLTSEVHANWSADSARARWLRVGGREYEPDTSDAMYEGEMRSFLASVRDGAPTPNDFTVAAETLRWALKARDISEGLCLT